MQTTSISLYSLLQVLRANARGIMVVGYTVRPGFSNGLFMYAMMPRGHYIGWKE